MLISINLSENDIWHCHRDSELDTANAWLQRKRKREGFYWGLVHRCDSAEPGGGSKWMGRRAHTLAGAEHPQIVAVQTGALFPNGTTKHTIFLLHGFLKQLNTHCRPWTSQVLSGPIKSVILVHSSSSWCKAWQQRCWCETVPQTPNICARLTLSEGCTTAPSLLFCSDWLSWLRPVLLSHMVSAHPNLNWNALKNVAGINYLIILIVFIIINCIEPSQN